MSRYLRANANPAPLMIKKHTALASGPTLPPVNQSLPRNAGRIRCPGSTVPLSGTEYKNVCPQSQNA